MSGLIFIWVEDIKHRPDDGGVYHCSLDWVERAGDEVFMDQGSRSELNLTSLRERSSLAYQFGFGMVPVTGEILISWGLLFSYKK